MCQNMIIAVTLVQYIFCILRLITWAQLRLLSPVFMSRAIGTYFHVATVTISIIPNAVGTMAT
jgi:hypothetical protein